MTIGSNMPSTPSSTERVYQTIVEMHGMGRSPTREAIIKETGLRYSVVDDSIKRLRDQDRIERVVNGIFEPVVFYQDRPVSLTIVHLTGIIKAEIGDVVLDLTPREGRALAKLLAGMILGVWEVETCRYTELAGNATRATPCHHQERRDRAFAA